MSTCVDMCQCAQPCRSPLPSARVDWVKHVRVCNGTAGLETCRIGLGNGESIHNVSHLVLTRPQSDVDEALRLMRQSKASLESSGPAGGEGGVYEDAVSLVYRLIREYSSRSGQMEVPWAKIQELTARQNVSVGTSGGLSPLRPRATSYLHSHRSP